MLIHLTDQPVDPKEAVAAVRHPSCGAVASFQGDIREENEGKRVWGLEYQVYEKFFYAETERIFGEAKTQWGVHKIALIQRVGRLDVGETGIFIAVSSVHRREALRACDYIIEQFKKRAPVWKKEFGAEGETWVECRHS